MAFALPAPYLPLIFFVLFQFSHALHFTPASTAAPSSVFHRPTDPSDYPYPCPTPPPDGQRISGAFEWHHDFQNEWYYVSGSLVAVHANGLVAPMGYQISTTMYNTTGAQLTTENNIAVSAQDGHISAEGMGPAVFGQFDLSFASAAMTTSYTIQKGNPGEIGSVYLLKADNANMSVALTLTAMAPLMYQGEGGYYGYSYENASCPAYYYVTIPRLWTTGTIQLNNMSHSVTGYSWFDHEWGGDFPGWYWLGLNVGASSIMITVPRINETNHFEYSIMDVQDMDGNMSKGQITGIEVLGNWTSPTTGIVYPTQIRMHSNHPDFLAFSTQPFFDNQESGPILHFWEGDVKVVVEIGTQKGAQGVGYLELVGFGADKTKILKAH